MTAQSVERRPMTWAEYEALGESVHGEYIDGELVVSPFPDLRHGEIIKVVIRLLDAEFQPEFTAVSHFGWKPGPDEFGPDVILVPRVSNSKRFEGTPPVVCEIVSGNRADDLVRKTGKYARAGAPHYWVIDPVEATAWDFRLDLDGVYAVAAKLDELNPLATFSAGTTPERGVTMRFADLFG